jgi:Protein of unknown function (DUF2845)
MKILWGFGLLMMATLGHADSLRCEGKLIATGDSKGSVEQKCGAPASQDSYCKPSAQPASKTDQTSACTWVDIWRYNRGQGQFSVEVEFQQGVITAINNAERG